MRHNNHLSGSGSTIAALAMVILDNPMCPVTGHRICNDCMKSCIYQKQEPVNIPQYPIINYAKLKEELDNRITTGFGGVAEYGITVHWDIF